MNWWERDILSIRHPGHQNSIPKRSVPFRCWDASLKSASTVMSRSSSKGPSNSEALGVKNSWRVEVCIFRFFEQVFSGGDALNISEMSTTIALCKTLLPQRKVCNIVPLPAWVKELDLSSSSSSSCSEMKQNLILFYASSYSPRLPQSKIIATWRIVLKK